MGVLRKRWCDGVCGMAMAVALAGVCSASTRTRHVDPWTAAVQARAAFEAEPKAMHTRAEYARVMDGFRAIYHDDPQDVHAARAVEQVAELLEEQGAELHDRKAMSDAVGQLDFLKRAYPGYRAEPLGGARVQGSGSRVQKANSEVVVPTSHPSQAQDRDVGHPTVMDGPPEAAVVTGIRHWSTATYTRLAIDLTGDDGDEVKYEAARVEHPDRIFFDLHHAKLAPQLEGKSFAVTDGGFLTRIRAAQAGEDVTRVVLDVPEVAEYSAFLLPNPERLIIDIHGRAANSEQATGNGGAPAPIVRMPARSGGASR